MAEERTSSTGSVVNPLQRYAAAVNAYQAAKAELKEAERALRRFQAVVDGRGTAREPAKCGTDGGYYRHLRTIHTAPCGPCKAAHARVEADRAARKRAERDRAA